MTHPMDSVAYVCNPRTSKREVIFVEFLDSEGELWQSRQGRLIHPVPSIPTKKQVRGNSRDTFIHCGPIGKKNKETQYHQVCLPGINRGLCLNREQRACIINRLGQGLVSAMVLAAKSVLKSGLITCETSPPPSKFLLLALGHQLFPSTISWGKFEFFGIHYFNSFMA